MNKILFHGILIFASTIVISCFSESSNDDNIIKNESVSFDFSTYWENNGQVQGECERIDSLCITDYKAGKNDQISSSEQYYSSSISLSSSEIHASSSSLENTPTESSSSLNSKINDQVCEFDSVEQKLKCEEGIYKTTRIGSQTWMAENLSLELDSGTPCVTVPNTPCFIHGRYYQWETAVDLENQKDNGNSYLQGICPNNWHIPSRDEWLILIEYVVIEKGLTTGKSDDWEGISTYLRGSNGWYGTYYGTNDFGFDASPGGYSKMKDRHSNKTLAGYWWATEENGNDNNEAHLVIIGYGYPSNGIVFQTFDKEWALSVRCIKD